ncbi:MAG: glucosaminidase domain-containing protein [Clostridia bacterium]
MLIQTGNRDYDGAYLGGNENGRIRTKISGLSGWVTTHLDSTASGTSEIIPISAVKSPSYYTINGGELKHFYTRNITSGSGIYASNILGRAPNGLVEGGKYYSYDGNYFYLDLITMLEDYKAGHTNNAVNSSSPYYNYYQYLPERTKTNITARDIDGYLNSKVTARSALRDKGQAFIDAQNKNSVNAAYLYAAAVHESASGTSWYALNNNNIFGIAVFDTDLGNGKKYNSVDECIREASELIFSLGYADVADDSRYFGAFLGNKASGMNVKYASDPYWGEIIAARYYALDKYAGFKDYNKETIGIKTSDLDVNVRKGPTLSDGIVYAMKNNKAGISVNNLAVTIVEAVNGQKVNGSNLWYKIRSETILNSSKNTIPLTYGKGYDGTLYNFADPYIYVHSSYITKANQGIICTHTFSEYQITAQPTCEQEGEKTRVCSLCHVEEKQKIPALGHAYDEGKITKNPTCMESGIKTYTCTRCGKTKTEEINKLEHKYGEFVVTKNPTCETPGEKVAKCSVGNEEKKESIMPLGHKYTKWTNTKEPTEFDDGIKESICDVCHKKETVVAPATGKYIEKPGLLHLENFTWNKGSQKLDISGFLAIKEIDNSDAKKYSIQFVNMKTKETTTVALGNWLAGYPFEVPAESGKDLRKSWYKASINLEILPAGDYTACIIAKQDNYMTKQVLSNMFSKDIVKKGSQGNRSYVFTTNYFNKQIPIEINVRNTELTSTKEPPSSVSMFNTIFDVQFKDNKLKIVGTSFNVGGDYSTNTDVKRQFILEDVNNFAQTKFTGGYTNGGPYVVTLIVPDGKDKTRAWFDNSLDVTTLPNGTYSVIVRTYTNVVDDSSELNDIFMTDLSNKSMQVGGRTYTLALNKDRKYRLELTIK